MIILPNRIFIKSSLSVEEAVQYFENDNTGILLDSDSNSLKDIIQLQRTKFGEESDKIILDSIGNIVTELRTDRGMIKDNEVYIRINDYTLTKDIPKLAINIDKIKSDFNNDFGGYYEFTSLEKFKSFINSDDVSIYDYCFNEKINKETEFDLDNLFSNNFHIVFKSVLGNREILDLDNTYLNNHGKKSFQWELWPYCNSMCDFCYLKEENTTIDKEKQLTSLNDLENEIDNLNFSAYNNISLIGGEFFQGQLNDQEVHDKFFDIIKKIFKLYNDKKIGIIWITATLTIGDQKHLYELLDLAEEYNVKPIDPYASSGIWICTSWDSSGRFHNLEMKSNWEKHMKNIFAKYQWIHFNTTIILQQSFIELYLNNKFRPKEFMKEFNTTIFYKQPGLAVKICGEKDLDDFKNKWLEAKIDANKSMNTIFFPKRSTFLNFLTKYYQEDQDTFDRLYNIKYRADELHRNDHGQEITLERFKEGQEETGERIKLLECGHIHYYMPYCDSVKCCLCDKQAISNE